MYKAGEAEVCIISYDSRDSQCGTYLGVRLPHSCDEWVIGGREQIKLLIAELQQILEDIDS